MFKLLLLTPIFLLTFFSTALADDMVVTRHFTGLWEQAEHESQGVDLQIAHRDHGPPVAVAFWFTYGADNESRWFLGQGSIVGKRIELVLFHGTGIGFLELDAPGNDRVMEVGTMVLEFSNCNEGHVTFTTTLDDVGSGDFPIRRLTRMHNSRCSGGISDDTPSDVLHLEQRIALGPARDGILGSGHADFEQRADRSEFSVEVEDLANGAYRIMVGGEDRGELLVELGIGETEFRSPAEDGKLLLTFDPRGQLIEVHDDLGAVLTSGDAVFEDDDDDDGDDDNGDDDAPGPDIGMLEIEVDLVNTGVYPLGSGDAELESREDRVEFSVEIEDVPVGGYRLLVDGSEVGLIEVVELDDGSIEGELEFRNPVEPGKLPLDFDPRGKNIEVLEGETVIFEVLFPSE